MKNGTFTVIWPNMMQTEMSIREADAENDLCREAFELACKDDKPTDVMEQMFAWDFFKYGWEAAVRCLNDDAARQPQEQP